MHNADSRFVGRLGEWKQLPAAGSLSLSGHFWEAASGTMVAAAPAAQAAALRDRERQIHIYIYTLHIYMYLMYIYIYITVCACVYTHMYIYIHVYCKYKCWIHQSFGKAISELERAPAITVLCCRSSSRVEERRLHSRSPSGQRAVKLYINHHKH